MVCDIQNQGYLGAGVHMCNAGPERSGGGADDGETVNPALSLSSMSQPRVHATCLFTGPPVYK